MLKRYFLLLPFLALLLGGWTHGVGYIPQTYYISTGGSDSNNGTSSGSPWLTPNHAVSCGDTIIMAAGAYGNQHFNGGNWGVVQNCPSTAGAYFAKLLCAGPVLTSCTFGGLVIVDQSNWALQGIYVAAPSTGCFAAAPSSAITIHHIAFINVIANGCTTSGITTYQNAGGGVDYVAVVGAIVYNAAQGTSECFSGISFGAPINYDSKSGTHYFTAGVFSYGNIDGNGCASGANSDGEGIIFDSFGISGYTGQSALEQSMLLGNGAPGVEVNTNANAAFYIFNNTIWGNFQSPYYAGGTSGDLFFSQSTNTNATSATNNLIQATVQTKPGSSNIYAAYVTAGNAENIVNGNYTFGVGGNNTGSASSPGFSFGTNTAATPNFVSPVTPSAPSCSSYSSVYACMDAAGVIANFTAQAVGASGLGYQPPGNCTADAYFPTWLNGIIPIGLITQPCGTN
jgi:hypothetical protein